MLHLRLYTRAFFPHSYFAGEHVQYQYISEIQRFFSGFGVGSQGKEPVLLRLHPGVSPSLSELVTA